MAASRDSTGSPRYIAVETPEGWMVRDTEQRQNLLGVYEVGAARRNAKRLNANINLSPPAMRALRLVAALGEVSLVSVGRTFKGNMLPGAYESGMRVCKLLQSHGFLTFLDRETVIVTEWGREWLGL